jgi:hypothetical protein
MSKVITIEGKQYPGYKETEPDSYRDSKDRIDNLFYKIDPIDYETIQKGSMIMYYKEDKVVSGIILKYIEPDIFILKNDIKMCIWSYKFKDKDLYIKDYELIRKENQLKENLFELYNAGYIEILDEPKENSK